MAMLKCDRCGEKAAKVEMCSSCRRLVCKKCAKTSKKVSRKDIKRMIMCKDCWTDLSKRKIYRTFTAPKETFEERTERYGPRPRYGKKRSFGSGGGPPRR
jgi:hypothetical protein